VDQPQLLGLCRQFEAALLRSIIPSSMFGQRALAASSPSEDAGAEEDDSNAERSSPLDTLFSDAFAQALERAGGVGLAADLYRSLGRDRSSGAGR
jgi:hypothetical protein